MAGCAQLQWTVRRGTVTVVGVTLRLWRARDRRRRGYERVSEVPSAARKGGVGGALDVFLTVKDKRRAVVRLRTSAAETRGHFAHDRDDPDIFARIRAGDLRAAPREDVAPLLLRRGDSVDTTDEAGHVPNSIHETKSDVRGRRRGWRR